MNRRKLSSVLFLASILVSCVLAASAGPEPAFAGAESYFPNVVLTTHDNKEVRFYDDLVKGKVVLINFMFTNCKRFCPVTYSITLDPVTDTPEVFREDAKKVGAGSGWTFLTAKKETIDKLRRKLGVYDRNPVIDADITQHGGLVVYGNDAIGRWASISGLNKTEVIVRAVLRVTESHQRAERDQPLR
jgi:protein SCO1/2